MFGELLKSLLDPEPAPLADRDARLALAALLVRLARTDGDYAVSEKAHIDHVLETRYGLDNDAAAALRHDAETLETQAPDTVRFTRAIKDAVDYDDRILVIEAMWDVALADGHRDEDEDALLRMVASFLGINDRDSALARQKVLAQRNG